MSIYLTNEDANKMKDMILIIQSKVEKLKQEKLELIDCLEKYANDDNWNGLGEFWFDGYIQNQLAKKVLKKLNKEQSK